MNEKISTALGAYYYLSEKAIKQCEETPLSFRLWVRHYGLYCSGKEIGAETTTLGQALCKAQLGRMTKSEIIIVEKSRAAIVAELSENASLNLKQKR